jgi:carbonic anhydrase
MVCSRDRGVITKQNEMNTISAEQALERLREGNRRFATGSSSTASVSQQRRTELVTGQAPFAVILGCLDSRVPVETIFDQGLGDLAVVRVAGNIAGPSQIASVEIAAQLLGARLVVVLGHSSCAAVRLTLDWLMDGALASAQPIESIQEAIRPAVADWVAAEDRLDTDACMARAVRSNVMQSAEQLRCGSDILASLITEEGLQIVGAEYSLESGVVEFLDVESPRA